MRVWFKRLVCALEGHPVTVSHLEMFDGVLRATSESCECGRRGALVFPGAHFKVIRDAYADYPTEWAPLFSPELSQGDRAFLYQDTH